MNVCLGLNRMLLIFVRFLNIRSGKSMEYVVFGMLLVRRKWVPKLDSLSYAG